MIGMLLLAGCRGEEVERSVVSATKIAGSREEATRKAIGEFVGRFSKPGDLIVPGSAFQGSASSLRSEKFSTLIGAKDLVIDSVGEALAGRRIVARSHFTGVDGKVYRTNFVLTNSDHPEVVSATVPSYASKPAENVGQSMSAPKV